MCGTPARRSSSAVGSGLWWKEPKITARSARSAAIARDEGFDVGRVDGIGLGVDPRRAPLDPRVDAGQQLRGAPAARAVEERDALGAVGEGADGRAGEQDVAVVVEADGQDVGHRDAPPVVGAGRRTAGIEGRSGAECRACNCGHRRAIPRGCRSAGSKARSTASARSRATSAAASTSSRQGSRGRDEDRSRAGGPGRLDVGADVADHHAARGSTPRRSAARSTSPGAGLRQSQPSSGPVRAPRPRAERAEQRLDPGVDRAHLRLGEQPAGDAALVGDTPVGTPAARSRSSAARAPGTGSTRAGSPLYGTSTTSVPSRSKSTAAGRPGSGSSPGRGSATLPPIAGRSRRTSAGIGPGGGQPAAERRVAREPPARGGEGHQRARPRHRRAPRRGVRGPGAMRAQASSAVPAAQRRAAATAATRGARAAAAPSAQAPAAATARWRGRRPAGDAGPLPPAGAVQRAHEHVVGVARLLGQRTRAAAPGAPDGRTVRGCRATIRQPAAVTRRPRSASSR